MKKLTSNAVVAGSNTCAESSASNKGINMKNLNCNVCNVVVAGNAEYCSNCAEVMSTNKGEGMSKLSEQRDEMIAKLYGEDAIDNEWLMFKDRNTSTIAFNATKYGIDVNEVLTRNEVEDLSKMDADYEMADSDLVDYGARAVKDKYTREQIREMMKHDTPVCDEDVVEEVYEEPSKPFISQQQKETNLSFYMRRLEGANKASTIGWLGFTLFNAIKGSERTFEIMDEDGGLRDITAPTFFPKGTYKEFWAFYNKRKAELQKEIAAAPSTIENIEKTLYTLNRASAVRKLKQSIYNAKLTYLEKKSLWDECDKRINALSA